VVGDLAAARNASAQAYQTGPVHLASARKTRRDAQTINDEWMPADGMSAAAQKGLRHVPLAAQA
jgi:hypothetical protein